MGFFNLCLHNQNTLYFIIIAENITLTFLKQKQMKKILFALFTLTTVAAQAQTAEEIVAKYAVAIGGLDAFNKVTSARMTGSVAAQGSDFPLTTQVLNGKGMRTDVDVMGQSITNVYFNGKGWELNPFGGIETPTEVTGAKLKSFKAQASLASNLLDYKNRGHKIELGGEETLSGVKTWKIILTDSEDGKKTTYNINQTDFLVAKSASKREVNGQEVDTETILSGYKDFGGLKFATSTVQMINGNTNLEISLSNVELNVKIDEKIFDQ
jgi:hypothetical protein